VSKEERTWSRCPICEKWKPTPDVVRVSRKGFLVRGYRYFYMCKPCAKKVVARLERRAKVTT